MRFLATLHRWWGVAFCLLFAMWFASGIVMHFVPFPARSERPVTPEIDAARAGAELIDYDQWTVAGDYDYDRPLFRYALDDAAGTEIYVSSRSGKIVLTTTRDQRLANYAGSIAHWIYPTELRHHRAAWSALMWWLSLLGTMGAAAGVIIGLGHIGIRLNGRLRRDCAPSPALAGEGWDGGASTNADASGDIPPPAALRASTSPASGRGEANPRKGPFKKSPTRMRPGKAIGYEGLQRWHHLSGLIFAPFLLAWIFSGFLSMDDGSLFAHSDVLFRALHKLDFPPLATHPWLRTSAIVVLCLCGLAFSLTGVVLAWRRLSSNQRRKFPRADQKSPQSNG